MNSKTFKYVCNVKFYVCVCVNTMFALVCLCVSKTTVFPCEVTGKSRKKTNNEKNLKQI